MRLARLADSERIHYCGCESHGFTVAADADDGVVYMTSWTYGNVGTRLSWYDRAKWCVRILFKGEPFDDQAILSPETAEGLGRALIGAAAEADVHSEEGKEDGGE